MLVNISTFNQNKWIQILLKDVLIVLTLTTLVGLSISMMSDKTAIHSLRYAWSIGMSIITIKYLLRCLISVKKTAFIYIISVPVGSVIGVAIGTSLNGNNFLNMLENQQQGLTTVMLSALLFGTAITYYFYSQNRITENKSQIQLEKTRQALNEKQLIETELRLLQAQIEPHFLFNTLSNVLALIDTDSKKAGTMLEAFTLFLRASLRRTREHSGTLRDELDLVNSYLTIQSIRMQDQLVFNINIKDDLLNIPVPPLLIQPLVENAVHHGLEPTKEQGSITISTKSTKQFLIIEVADTGSGLTTNNKKHSGIGLNNVRQRLQSLYDNKARLELLENKPHGVIARVYLPLQDVS